MSTPWSLCERESGRIIVPELELATTFWQRFRGLQFRHSLPEGRGLLIAPCRSIHTQWMRFPIDVVFFDKDACAVDVRISVQPWRFLKSVPGAVAVLELPANSTQISVGEYVALLQRMEDVAALPRGLNEWKRASGS